MRLVIILFFAFSLLLKLAPGILYQNQLFAQTSGSSEARAGHLWGLSFGETQAPARQALEQLGFSLEKEMEDEDKITLMTVEDRLHINAESPAFGLMVKKDINLEDSEIIEIEWGIHQYPEGADWDSEINREAIMVYLFFGEPIDADKFYLPDSPMFLGLFLCRDEQQLMPYLGKNYRETGRYICLGEPEQGETVTTSFNFDQAFREMFDTDEVLPVTGLGIEVDTSDLPDGTSSAFIKYIGLTRAAN